MKIKLLSGRSLIRKRLLLSIMKTFIFLLCTTVFSLTTENTFSQEKVTIDKDQLISVDQVFRIIKKQTNYRFIYPKEFFKDVPKIELRKGEISLNNLLKLSIPEDKLNFELTYDDVIVFKEKEKIPENNVVIQQQQISGIVTDNTGVPLPGVNVIIAGTTTGTQTDFDGNYTIKASKGDILAFSYIGMKTVTITVGDLTTMDVVLNEDAAQLEEVVVTALGIRKEKKRVGFAVQEVDGESIQKAVSPNIVESLTGKVSGLIVTNNTSDFFSDPQFYLRGARPLMVVDGVPQTNSDVWNLASDDIESITVLKGGASSALYGSLGKNGAIQITMKSGSSGGNKGVAISYNSSTMFQDGFLRIPKIQTEYGPGNNGQYRYGGGLAGGDGKTLGGGINDFDYSIWGPKFDGRLIEQFDSPIDPVTGYRIPTPWVSRGPDNLKNFMEVGLITSNNITVQASSDKGSFIISNTYKYSKASTPGQKLDINTTRVKGDINISDKINIEGSIQYNYQYSDNRIRGSYGPTSPLYNLAIWGGAHFDVRNFKENIWEEGKEGIRQNFVEHWRFNNPYILAHAWKKPWTKNDAIAYLKFNYKFSDYLTGYVRSTLNAYTLTSNEEIHKDIYDYSISDRGGRFRYYNNRYFENNTDFLLQYNKTFFNDDFGVSATLGGNQRYYRNHSESATTTGLIVPGIFKLSNSIDQVQPSSYKEQKGVYSAYASFDLAYKNALFVGFTGRFDKSSTQYESHDTFFYPSMYMSAVVSDIFELPEAISFFKLRTSYANVGGDLPIYGAGTYYSTGGRWRNLPTASYPSRLENPNLKPSFNSAYEYGFEMKLFKGRFGIDFSYYENVLGPDIFTQRFSQASTFSGIQQNGRTTERRGMDFSISAIPFKTDNFSWTTIINFDKYKQFLTELPPLEDGTIPDREGRTFVGNELGHYWWNTWDRTSDGQLIIGANGSPVSTPAVDLGRTSPDFTVSLNNTIRYKNLSLNFLIDGRYGGITFDRYERDLWRSGSHPDAIHPEREASNIAFATGGDPKTMLIPGMAITGGEVTYDAEGVVIEDTRTFEPNATKVTYPAWASYKGDWRSNIIEKTFAKLREVTLTYNIPSQVLDKTFFKAASISLIGRNLLYWTKDDTFGDLDTYTVSTGDTNLQQPSQRSYGFNLNFKF